MTHPHDAFPKAERVPGRNDLEKSVFLLREVNYVRGGKRRQNLKIGEVNLDMQLLKNLKYFLCKEF